MGETYGGAGVDIDAGDEAVDRIRDAVRSTARAEVLDDIGGFAGLFALDRERWREPVLVASTDGVGTKVLLAEATGRVDTVGIDLVAMCVDDLVCCGAEPLFFLDYLAVGRLDPDQVSALVAGVAAGCRLAGCALLGGETAEHPGALPPGRFDLAGFAVGVVERDRVLTGEAVTPGDVVLGLPSPGLRSNGYSLARRVLLEVAGRDLAGPAWEGAGHSLADELLRPSVIYAPAVVGLLRSVEVHALAHVTGGGLPGNLARVLPDDADAVIRRDSWVEPPIFGEIRRLGPVAEAEMERVFNLGVGMVVVVPTPVAAQAVEVLRSGGHDALVIGEIVPGGGQVTVTS